MNTTASMAGRAGQLRDLKTRIMNVLPAASYQMDRFLQLADVVLSDRTKTACVEVGPQPRLHLNADFVARHCRRDEHLLMLILHELYHVILGHTRLFPRTSTARNIAFDAVINAMLCRQLPEPCYTEFFQALNPWNAFPGCLLRPPPGWPERPKPLPRRASKKQREVVELLYGASPDAVTYGEILDLLEEEGLPKDGDACVLLGDHGAPNGDGESDSAAVRDDLVTGVLQRVVEGWPAEAELQDRTRGTSTRLLDFLLPPARTPRADFLVALRRLLDRAGVFQPKASSPRSWQMTDCVREASTVVPDWQDRHACAREALMGHAPVFYSVGRPSRRPRWQPRPQAHVYLDVSGSMVNELPWLVGALAPLLRRGAVRLYVFSTVVDEVKGARLAAAVLANTGGTDIDCVYRHVLGLPRPRTPRRVVVLTDGYTGAPGTELLVGWERRGIQLFVGLVASGWNTLRPHATHIERLPALG